jgi:hypothetical protein
MAITVRQEDHAAEWLKRVEGDTRKGLGETAKKAAEMTRSVTPRATGNLASTVEGHEDGSVTAGGSKAPYGFFVHNGTHRIAARPFMIWGSQAAIPAFVDRMKEALKT